MQKVRKIKELTIFTGRIVHFRQGLPYHNIFSTENSKGHRASIFMLENTGNLLRRDLRTGAILDEVYLPPRYNFVELIEDREVGYLYVRSKIYAKANENVISAFAIFSFPHLEFSAFLEVEKSVFGNNAIKTEICQGNLMVLHSNNTIKLYSLKYILSKFLVQPFKLGETFIENNLPSSVGKLPLGLPVNVLITSAPPVLLEVKSAGHSLQIGGHPWHYITCPSTGRFQVFNMQKNLAVDGLIEESGELEPDVIVFHPDESLKIVQATSGKILIYKITLEPNPKLETFFSLDAFDPKDLSEENLGPKISSYGRKIYSRAYTPPIMSLMLFDYEDELDIFAILRVKQPVIQEGSQLEIILTDSSSGKILGSHALPDCSWPKIYECQYSFEIDGPLLIVNTKRYGRLNSTMHVFLLQDSNNVKSMIESMKIK